MRATVWLVSARGDFRRRSGSPGALAMIGFLTRPRWSAVDWSLLVLLAMVILPQFALPAVGRWEGLIAPAAGDFRITWIEGTAQPRP